jgi:hypothetical protein
MTTVADMLDGLAHDLADRDAGHEHTVWARKQLLNYLREAFQVICASSPDVFARDVTVTLGSGPQFHRPCECDALSVSSVLGQSDRFGQVLWPLRLHGEGPRFDWQGSVCPARGDPPRLREYSLHPDGRSIRVYPDIPPGRTVHLALRCAVLPKDEPDDVPDRVLPPAVQWALYRAKTVDGENNPPMLQAANAHLTAFAALTGTKLPRGKEGG